MALSRQTRPDGDGFTIIELMIALAIAAFAFVALGGMLLASLRALSVQKSRTQGNEFATLGIEDLQRLDFDRLAFCPNTTNDPNPQFIPDTLYDTTLTPPAPLEKVVASGSCSSAVYGDPCNPSATSLSAIPVPKQVLTCVRNNITYTVNRYIVWADAAKTNKRLAVFVEWVDEGGNHRVAQQSSLRIPNPASIFGGPPPQILSAVAAGGGGGGCATVPIDRTCAEIADADGALTTTLSLTVTTSGLTSSDAVSVNLQTRSSSSGGTIATAIPLTSANGSTWSTTINSGGLHVRPGDQVLYVTVVRVGDGKTNSRFVTDKVVRFCTQTANCGTSGPTFAGAPTVPSTINIDHNGVVQGTSSFSIQVLGLTPAAGDYVTLGLQTAKGAVLIPMQAPPNTGCSGSACETWTLALTSANGYRFNSGVQSVYFTATKQATALNPGGSAIYSPPPTVNFQ